METVSELLKGHLNPDGQLLLNTGASDALIRWIEGSERELEFSRNQVKEICGLMEKLKAEKQKPENF